MKKRTALFIISCLFIAAGLIVYIQRQWIKDVYIVYSTDLNTDTQRLAKNIDLTEDAQFLFEASQTELQDAASFRTSCKGLERQGIVLGCYAKQRIYIYDVTDKRLSGVREVTAAHELLHAVYERLPVKERERINQLLLKQAESSSSDQIKDTLELYKDLDKDEYLNELHSIVGTQLSGISKELETYYAKYFMSREKIVKLSDKYQKTFLDYEKQIKAYDTQLKDIKSDIDELQRTIKDLKSELDSSRTQLEKLKQAGEAEAYNQRVPAYNQQVELYNTRIRELRAATKEYNEIVQKRNTVAVAENDLVDKLDGTAEYIRQ